jgi:hypothetical protein
MLPSIQVLLVLILVSIGLLAQAWQQYRFNRLQHQGNQVLANTRLKDDILLSTLAPNGCVGRDLAGSSSGQRIVDAVADMFTKPHVVLGRPGAPASGPCFGPHLTDLDRLLEREFKR